MGGPRFRYALEPVALQRLWALDAVRQELSEHNFKLAEQRKQCQALAGQMAQATMAWRAQAAPGAVLQVERHAVWLRYLADQRRQMLRLEETIAVLQTERDAIIDRLASAQRAVEAIDEHRSETRVAFFKARSSAELKEVDDQWNVLQTGRRTDGD
jgi:chromosome segregation ATPase